MKKTLILLMSVFMLFSGATGAFAERTTINNGPKYEVLEATDSYEKVKITNEDGTVEYLEGELVNGNYKYTSTDSDGNVLYINSDDENVIVTNAEEEIVLELSKAEVLSNDELGYISTEKHPFTGKPIEVHYGLYDNVPKNTSWANYYSYKGSKEVQGINTSAIAGIFASVVSLSPVAGVIVTIASAVYSYHLPKAWYKVTVQTRYMNGKLYKRKVMKVYKYHDYTGYIGMVYGNAELVR
ncbi:hypothetical protein CJ195_03575 [Bacillus sp. UMB0899]|uniref:hypothetical protein n=1 Tax=Metabacillus schmidteae TaxID=2730405 RepID=UPI000C80BE3F|nr:hypothetical protein [Metabacillus schmidteae]PMC40779.1 hypothetical protein CJ195_03575 [Bacillus sp. UMB0899]